MADGKITYEVRVGSSHIASDIMKSKARLSMGANQLVLISKTSAKRIGAAFSSGFSSNVLLASSVFGKLGTNIAKANTAAMPLRNTVNQLSQQLKKLTSIDYSNATAFFNALKSVNGVNVSVSSGITTRKAMGSFRSGTDYVPYDNFPAILHKGEAVLTSAENSARAKATGTHMLSDNASKVVVENKVELPQSFYAAVSSLAQAGKNVNLSVELNGREVARAVADASNELTRQYNKKIYR